jgi:predicted exporter
VTALRGRLPLLFWLAWVLAAVWIAVAYTRVTSELTEFLPRGADAAEQILLEQVRQGAGARIILIALYGAPHATLARASADLAEALRDSDLFTQVNNGALSSWSVRDRQLLFEHRYVLSPQITASRFTTEALHASLQERLQTLVSPLGVLEKRSLPHDPTGELQNVLHVWTGQQAPAGMSQIWFSTDGSKALLMAQTRAPAFALDAQAAALARIKDEVAHLAEKPSPKLLLSGPAVFAVEARATIRHELALLSTLAIVSLALFLLAVYRSPLLLLLSVVPLGTGILTAVACVSLLFGSIHGITLAFGITIIGVAVDYPIHLFSHTHAGEASARALARIWPTLRLGVLTTVLGYTAMVFSGFPGVSQLGVFAVAGLLAAAAVTRWVLPMLAPARLATSRRSGWSLSAWIAPLHQWRWLPLLVIAAGLVYVVSEHRPLWETDLAKLSPIASQRRALDQELRAAMGASDVRRLLIVTGAGSEQVLRRSERLVPALQDLVGRGWLAGYDAASRYLPSVQAQHHRQATLPPADLLRTRLHDAMRGLPFRQGLFEPFIADVAAARHATPLTLADFRDTALELRLQALLFAQQGQWVGLIPLRGVADDAKLRAWVTQLNDPRVRYVDLKQAANRLVNLYRDKALLPLTWGAGAIVFALWFGLRSLRSVLRVLLPVAAAVTGVVVLLLVLGQPLSVFHLVALLLVVGVGLDYGLFFNRTTSDDAEREQTVRALAVCGISTTLVFGLLAFSQTPVLRAIGTTVAIGVILCFLLAAVFARNSTPTRASG